jgi:multidrug efflux pump subunit AcrA (membrane-fusion protein)
MTGMIILSETSHLTVPRSAVLRDDKGSYLFTIAQGRAHRRDVVAGLEQDGRLAVAGSIAPGEPVVALGNYELRDGMNVEARR